jgi:hypothetical protein
MKNTYLHTDLNIKDVDASGKFQPAVPVKSDMAIFQRPEDTQRDIVAIKNETVIALNELSKEIKETRDGVIAFLVSISPEVQEARRRWYRAKPEQTGRVGVYEKWEKADPELLELPTIKEAKLKVAEIQARLSEAQGDLDRLQSEGTPRSKYVGSLIKATSTVNALAAAMERSTIEEIVYNTYKTRDLTRVPEQAINNARAHPNVLKYVGFKVTGLDPLKDSFGDAELSGAHARVNVAINKLIELITG